MTLEQKIAQMLMVGFSGDRMDDPIRKMIKLGLGGVGLFNNCPLPKKSNITSPQQLSELCKELQQESTLPLFIAVDQEGGKVARLSEKNGFTRPPSPQEMHHKVGQEYKLIAQNLKTHGINMNFAPCVDLNINTENPIIGKLGRSLSSNPDEVSLWGADAWHAQRSEGILSCLKHFPGHGSSTEDSHLGMVDITKSFKQEEFIPFQRLIEQGYDEMILTAHVIHKDYGTLPASLNPVYTNMLRNWGFTGLIVTDDLKMGAIEQEFGLEESLILAVLAGADLLAYFNNLPPLNNEFPYQAIEILCKAVRDRRIPEIRIEESSSRILAFKRQKLSSFF